MERDTFHSLGFSVGDIDIAMVKQRPYDCQFTEEFEHRVICVVECNGDTAVLRYNWSDT